MVGRQECERIFEKVVARVRHGRARLARCAGQREVRRPDPEKTEPKIRQVFVGMGETFYNRTDFERRLYLVRQRTENTIEFGELSEAAREESSTSACCRPTASSTRGC